MIKEISKKEFEKRFQEVNVYGIETYRPIYLENGVVLIDPEWNGECYIIKEDGKERFFRPVYKKISEDDFEIIGYEEL